MSKEARQSITGLAMVLPSFAILLIVVIIPIVQSFIMSLSNGSGGYDLSRYTYLFTDKGMRSNIVFTLRVTAITCVAVILISYTLAIYMRFNQGPIVNLIRKTYMIPLFIPGVIATYGLINLLGNHGWLARMLEVVGITLPRIIFDEKGIIIANLWFNIPFTTMLLSSALSGIPSSIIESAKDVGVGRLTLFTRFIFPLSYKTFLVALTFVFMGVIGSFTAPYLIGANSPQMLGVSMQQVFSVFQEREQAAAIAFFSFLLCSVLGAFYIRSMAEEEKAKI
ncbi:ABC transporter permease subunit [Paenibacillus taichungensis]|uniref:ABC-type spermidine/putrescine transport system permease subunit I n=1 Tax=Paenibacillus pabuli TaxID=1472 RepID=A0A855XM85_9BACL|nr:MULTISPECIES: ABC transporter permease subunit [Paenibacillus]MEC0111422.1 ABC transporter permease subunit [Paenibacillus taichungensis]MEC0198982.1 ABC transporter permease subunit [Paenibacillus taichungensis]PWW34408.1 ABC-type spermidine/putrescine transport system permease subunit I [Paenibacillus pabuli]PXW00829.1 ABC-type spermidine/putrescine transport system permease subunit I [Paenibacillus taichungensis]RAI98223.1 ABC-type spermidine/putrescine transport system permease subunit 